MGQYEEDWKFDPPVIQAAVGVPIRWTNQGPNPHTITSKDQKTFDSGVLIAKGTFSFTPTTKGEITYGCTIHPSMEGKILVQ